MLAFEKLGLISLAFFFNLLSGKVKNPERKCHELHNTSRRKSVLFLTMVWKGHGRIFYLFLPFFLAAMRQNVCTNLQDASHVDYDLLFFLPRQMSTVYLLTPSNLICSGYLTVLPHLLQNDGLTIASSTDE